MNKQIYLAVVKIVESPIKLISYRFSSSSTSFTSEKLPFDDKIHLFQKLFQNKSKKTFRKLK